MKRFAAATSTLTLVILMAMAAPGIAEEAPSFWQQLRNKLEGIAPQKKTTTTAVGGVRGAKDQSTESLYWKGEEGALVVTEEELASFNRAALAAMSDQSEAALAQFQQFLVSYPQSMLRPDALAAVAQLQATAAAAKSLPAPALEAPTPLAAPATPSVSEPAAAVTTNPATQ